MAHLEPYSYRALGLGEIRVLDILHGYLNDEIRFRIEHIALKDAPQSIDRLTRAAVQADLPPGWEVFETPEGRYLFCYDPEDDSELEDENAEFLTTWQHPDPKVDRLTYELPLEEDSWDEELCFEALSYVWGSPDNPEAATVVDEDGTAIGSFSIGQNLAAAIRYLRYTDKTRRLWVDAVCINQHDDLEKAVLVSRMNDLYRLAWRVVAWLGVEDDGSSLAVTTMAFLGKQVETTLDGFRLTSPGAQEPEWYSIDEDLPYDERTWDAIIDLVSRPWFSRVWTAQEILLANRLAVLQCGQATISWALFRRALECILDKSNIPKGRDVLSLARTSVVNGPDRPLHQILGRHSHRQCWDPHDKIYGMLGMAPPGFREATIPDYQQPYAETYRDAWLANSSLIKRWELFGCDTADRTIKAPSWVPDLIPQTTHSWSSRGQLATGSSELLMTYYAPDRIEVVGLCVATVETVGKLVPNASSAVIPTIRSWIAQGLEERQDLESSSSVTDACAITLAQGSLRERNPEEEGWPTLNEWKRYCRNNIFETKSTRKFGRGNHLDDLLFRRCEGRVFVKTQDGTIGLGPKDTRKGDIICVVLGCEQPLVLRPLPDRQYSLVGNCFVHDLQDMRALLGPLPPPWRVQVFDHPSQEFRRVYKFFNPDTKKTTSDDPRLQELEGWVRIPLEDLGRELTGDDPEVCDFFRNSATGEIVDSDPRLSYKELLKRGVPLESLAIR